MCKILKTFFLIALIVVSSCETFDLKQTEDPSGIPLDKIDPIYAFNYAQVELPDFINSTNTFTQRVTRQMAMTGGINYNSAFTPELFDNNWSKAFLILNTIKGAEEKANKNNQFFILGANRIIRCYILMTLVDMYGNIPYTEALQGNLSLTPKYDSSELVYEGIYNELTQAINDLNKTNTGLEVLQEKDLYYGNPTTGKGDAIKWKRLAKTLKLKMLNNSRLAVNFGGINVVSEMTALFSEDDLINTIEDDFAFKYSSNLTNPNSRHPQYNNHYDSPSPSYIANYMLWTVTREKGTFSGMTYTPLLDPRRDFYFFNQKPNLAGMDAQSLPCSSAPSAPDHFNNPKYSSFYEPSIKAAYCTSNFTPTNKGTYLGRDHGDNSGIPQDRPFRTLVGIYPAGGAIGPNVEANETKGAKGAGIMPMVLSSYVRFIKAEAKLTLGLGNTNDIVLLEDGIRHSITKSTTLINPPLAGGNPPSVANVNNYVNYVLSFYASATAEKKLEIIQKEYFIALWGNGIESYNNYRRTGYPSNFQPTIEVFSGDFYNTALYPAVAANNNTNVPANIRTRKVFWDKANLNLN